MEDTLPPYRPTLTLEDAKMRFPKPEKKPPALPASEVRGERKLVRKEFDLVKQMQRQEKNGYEIAEALKADFQQVNYALLTKTYLQYERAYKRP